MEKFYNTLINVSELEALLSVSAEHNNVVVIDCRFSLMEPGLGQKQYFESHIPNAAYAHLDHDLAGPITAVSGRHPLPEVNDFAAKLKAWGVHNNSQVVVYDHGPGAIAARLWWMLRWIGHKNGALLNGGFNAWCEAGLALSSEPFKPSAHDDVLSVSADQNMWLSTKDVQRDMSDIVLIDARSEDRFNGLVEPIDFVAGHVPGANNMPLEENLDPNGCFLDSGQLNQRFQSIAIGCGEDGDYHRVVHMCGSGVTACHNLLAMEMAGMHGSRLYVGSWSEWIRDPNRLVATESGV